LLLPFVISSTLEVLAFESAMYLSFVFLLAVYKIRKDLCRRDMTISKEEEGTIQENCDPTEKKTD